MDWLPLLIIVGILALVMWWDHRHPLVTYRSEDDPRWNLPDVGKRPMPKGWIDEARELHEFEEAKRALMTEFEQTKNAALSRHNGHGTGGC